MSDPHKHDHVRVPDHYVDPHGRPVDHALLGNLVSALIDGCDLCSELSMVLLTDDPVTTTRLIELAYISLLQREADPLAAGAVPRPPSPPLFVLFRAAAQKNSGALLQQVEEMDGAERRSAAGAAVSLMLRQLSIDL